ncbi:MAG: helicase-related protein [Nitrososphaerota archaeon]
MLKNLLQKKELVQYAISLKPQKYENKNESFLDYEILKENALVLKAHQLFVRNFFNPRSPYTRLLLKHMTGTGKTIAALSMALQYVKIFKNYNLENQPTIWIIGFSKSIFQKELLNRVEFGFISYEELQEWKKLRYLADIGTVKERDILIDYESRLKRRLTKKETGGFFKFLGYKEFFNRLLIFKNPDDTNLDEEEIMEKLKNGDIELNKELVLSFANSIIIADEIQYVYNNEEMNNYGIALRIILNIYDVPELFDFLEFEIPKASLRIIYLSATPITASPTEIVDLLNLLVPSSRIKEIMGKYIINKKDLFADYRNLFPDAIEKIKKLIFGYVSFLRDDNPQYYPRLILRGNPILIPKKYLTERINFYNGYEIPYLRFTRCHMSELHYKTYNKIYEGTLPPDGQALIDLVLPSPFSEIGVFRTKEIKQLAGASDEFLNKHQIKIITQDGRFIITGNFMKLENLRKYSTKYALMVEKLHNNLRKDKGKVFISHQLVHSSGVFFIQEVLRNNGFIDEFSNPSNDTLCSKCGITLNEHKGEHEFIPARFIILHGEIDKLILDRSIERFKSSENLRGYFYRVVIGSKIVNVGIDFNAIRYTYIMHVPPDYSTLLQIIGRGVRNRSHIGLPEKEREMRVYIFVTSLPSEIADTDFSYEEKRYFDKSQEYLVIQRLEKILNETAVDANINREIIARSFKVDKKAELGTLYFEPDPDLGKLPVKEEINTETFELFYSYEEVNLIIYIIKRLFIEQSPAFTYQDLWLNVKDPPFDPHINSELFSEKSFKIALDILTSEKADAYKSISDRFIRRLLDSTDRTIKGTHKLVYKHPFYISVPILVQPQEQIIGINLDSLSGIPDIDYESWNREPNILYWNKFPISKLLIKSTSYEEMKFHFYWQYRLVSIEKISSSVEVYDLEFHTKLIEDSIKYAFLVMINEEMPFSELHDFYFKMLYFYDRLDLIIFADHLPEEMKLYEEYILPPNPQFEVHRESGDWKYNAFLVTSIAKAYSISQTGNLKIPNFDRLNKFLGNKRISSQPSLESMNIEKQIIFPSKIRKVYSNILPVGHFLVPGEISIPRLYHPDLDMKKKPAWSISLDFIKYQQKGEEVENNIIIGYYEKNPHGLDIRFKLRSPKHKIKHHVDLRLVEKGSACITKKKNELQSIAKSLGINLEKKQKSWQICNLIKLKLLQNELEERRKVRHDKKYKRLRWFYMHFEKTY